MSKFDKGLTRKVKERVPYEVAKDRVRSALESHRQLSNSQLAQYIWPDNVMTTQAGSLAAGPMLRRMAKDGLIYEASRTGWMAQWRLK